MRQNYWFQLPNILIITSLLLAGCLTKSTIPEQPANVNLHPTITNPPPDQEKQPTVEATETPDSLVIWARYDLSDTSFAPGVFLKQFLDQFEADTGIEVIYEQVAWDKISQKLAIAAQSGGDVPDIVEIRGQQVQALRDIGALLDLTELVGSYPWVDRLNDADTRGCMVNGIRYCVALNYSGGSWYYNVADYPDGWPQSTEEFEIQAERLKAEGKYAATFFAGNHNSATEMTWAPMFYSNGGSIFDEEGKPNWASPQNVEVIEWMRSMLVKGYIPETCFTGDFTAGETPFVDGKAAAVRGGSWSYLYIPGLKEKYEANQTEIAGGFAFNSGKPYIFLNSLGWGVPAGAENPAAAIKFIDAFLSDEQVLAEWASNWYAIPSIDDALKNNQLENEFYVETAKVIKENGIFMQQSPYYQESLSRLTEALQTVMLYPDTDIMEELLVAQQEIINKYW